MAAESSAWRSVEIDATGERAKPLRFDRDPERNLTQEILEEFAEASGYGAPETAWWGMVPTGNVEASKEAWRDRQKNRGLCRYCPRPALIIWETPEPQLGLRLGERPAPPEPKQLSYCHVHREDRIASATRSYWRMMEDPSWHEEHLARRRERWQRASAASESGREGWRQMSLLPVEEHPR